MSSADKVLLEAKRLYDMGMAIHWLHKKSKRPVESGWTTGPRKEWEYLTKTYRPGMNVGVRLGSPSKIKGNFLAVIDVDVKSIDEKHGKEVLAALKTIAKTHTLPKVSSGRGNGSQHLYILTPTPVTPFKAFQSKDIVKVHMPSVQPSKKELATLNSEEIKNGIRLKPAWEIAFMGEGQQVVLPPSIHPDSGRGYKWVNSFKPQLALDFDISTVQINVDKSVGNVDNSEKYPNVDKAKPGPKTIDDFEVVDVELSWVPISEKIRQMILTGEGVEDRSAMLLPVSNALLKAGLSQNEVLSVLTDQNYYLGHVGYEHAKTKDRKRAAAWVFRYSLKKVLDSQRGADVFLHSPITTPIELTKEEIDAQQDLFEKEIHSWRLSLDITKDDKIRGTLKNTVMILENEVGRNIVRRNTFAFRDFYSVDTPWGGVKDKSLEDDDVVKIKLWISDNFGCEPTSNTIGEALTILATRNAFDPVVDWLDQLEPWDEVERLDTWLVDHFNAKGDKEYLAQVFRKWIVAMVMRAYKPGVKFDWMPIFEGNQGVGKSSFGRILCGEDYFLDWLPDLSNKDSALALQGIWSVEMGELASFRKNEIETVKAFITRTIDKVRPPYGMRWLEVKRRCVFFGTTNFETYLRDESGNRRFKPVHVGKLDFEQLKEDRNQLFAEAVWLVKHGFENERTLEISGEAKLYEASIQADKMVADESALMLETMRGFIEKELEKEEAERFPFSRFKMSDLFGSGTQHPFSPKPFQNWKYDSRNVQFAAKVLKHLSARKFKIHGVSHYEITIK